MGHQGSVSRLLLRSLFEDFIEVSLAKKVRAFPMKGGVLSMRAHDHVRRMRCPRPAVYISRCLFVCEYARIPLILRK
jgi:hypothetical protein